MKKILLAIISASFIFGSNLLKISTMIKKLLPLFLLLPLFSIAQTKEWKQEFKAKKAFIENKGQFKPITDAGLSSEITYAYDGQGEDFYFTKSGVVFEFVEKEKKSEKEKEQEEEREKEIRRGKSMTHEEWEEYEKEEHHLHLKIDKLTCQWIGANPNVKIISEGKNDFTHSYSYYDENGDVKHVNNAPSFKKLIYKDLYPNIDVVYELHPDGGIKYSVVVHPGGDISKVKLQYSKASSLKGNGTIRTKTDFGNVIDHAPATFYEGHKSEVIQSSYKLSNNIISFDLSNYDHSRTVVIDPWTQTPAVTVPSGVWEIEVDGAGNVYVIGGGTPMQLVKYNSAGVFQWIYNTPYDTSNGDWLGALATDNAGNSYVTRGSSASITKVTTGGAVVYTNNGGAFDEYWQIAFNCDQTRLLIGGTRLPFFPTGSFISAMIFDVNPANGNVISSVFVGWSQQQGIINNPDEVRCITSSYNAKYYYLTLDSLGAIDQALGASCPNPGPSLGINHTYDFSYKCEDFRPDNGNGPMSAIVADANFVYTQNGSTVHKRDLNTGAILATAAIPAGITNGPLAFTNKYQAGNSGIAMDNCGNVYVGSSNQIVKYDGNLNVLATSPTSYRVSDVEVSPSGDIVLCGSTGTSSSSSRTGYAESVNLSSCAPTVLTCCDANFCSVGPLCDTDPVVNLSANTGGGTWSSSPVTAGLNAATGAFDPSVAGVGTYTITYTLACGSSSLDIQVINCSAMSVCVEANGDLTVTGGTGPYDWDEWVPASSTPITTSAQCTACGGTWTFGACYNPFPIPLNTCNSPAGWSYFASGTTVTPPPGSDTIQVTDAFGNNFVSYDISTLPPCSAACDATITQAGPFCENSAATNLTAAQVGGTWSGTGITNATNGTFDPATAGAGSWVITYTLGCGDTDTMTVVVIPLPSSGTNGSLSLCSTDPATDLFNQLGGSPDAGGTWSPSMNSGTGVFDPAVDPAGVYTYTVTNPCGSSNSTVTVTISPNPSPGTNGTASLCANATSVNLFDSLGGAPDAGGTWSPVLTSGTGVFDPAVDAAGTYTYSINDCSGNPQTADVIVTIIALPNTGSNGAISLCTTDPATDLFNQLGGSPDVGGTWSPAMTSGTGVFDPAVDPAGTYTYTVTNSCGSSNNDVVVTISANPSPGTNGTASLCANAAPINLFDSLGGAPSAGGTWSPALTSGTGVFDPAVDAAGTYTYSINDCSGNPQTADVIVTVTPLPNTGSNGAISLCPGDPATDLFNQLGGTPDAGGTWSPALTSGTGVFDPAVDAAGTYTYTVTNSCGSSNNDVVVTITANPSPGTNGTLTICSNAGSTDLFNQLGGSPSTGGTWSPALASGTGVFDPAVDAAGTYTYTVIDCSGNPQTADVVVTVNPAPNSGIDGAISLCNTDPATDLFNQLGGTPDAGGTWSPAMASGTGVFDPAVDAAGTYTYTVTNSCGSSSNNVVVTVTSCTLPTAGYIVSNDTICEGVCVDFTDQSTGATSWQWTFNGGSPGSSTAQNPVNICFNTAGTFTIEQIVTNSNGSDTTTSSIVVNSTPIIDAGPDVTIELGQSTTLNATGTNGTYTWSPPTWLDCFICTSPVSTPDETITYTVIVVDSNGCSATDDVTVFVDYDNVIFIPNIFSPNGDGHNDVLYVRGKGVQTLQFFIYDRWGEKVFETEDMNIGWDGTFRGKKMNNAVFVYYVQATFEDGSEVSQKGDITLIR